LNDERYRGQETKQQQALPHLCRTINNKLRDNAHNANENTLYKNIDKKEGRSVLETHNYIASNFTGKQPNHYANHHVLDDFESPQGVVEKWKTIESTLANLIVWVKSM
jgi:hypothetical protein